MEAEELQIKTDPSEISDGELDEVPVIDMAQLQDMTGIDFNNMQQKAKSMEMNYEKDISADDFQIVDERDGMITINAGEDLTADERMFMTKVKPTRSESGKAYNYCMVCRKRIQINRNINLHMELHRQNQFFCLVNCGESFLKLEDCELHEFTAHGMNNLKCNVCQHKFPNYEALLLHRQKMHNKLKRHFCSLCREWFISEEELHEHWQALPSTCGRLLHVDDLMQHPRQYKLKNAQIADINLKHLKLKSVNWPSETIPKNADCDIKIKQEPLDDDNPNTEEILPDSNYTHVDFPVEIKTEIDIEDIKIKCEPFDFEPEDPLAQPSIKQEPALDSPLIPIEPTSSKTTQNITQNFCLKTMSPKAIVNANQLELLNAKNLTSLVSLSTAEQQNLGVKVLKLQNLKIVKLPPNAQPQLISTIPAAKLMTAPAVKQAPNANKPFIEFPTSKGQKLFNNSNFLLRQIVPITKGPETIKTLGNIMPLAAVNTNITEQSVVEKKPAVSIMPRANVQSVVKTMTLNMNEAAPAVSKSSVSKEIEKAPKRASLSPGEASVALPGKKTKLPKDVDAAVRTSDNKYICPTCGRQYSTKTILGEHIRANCGKEPIYKCNVCNKYFSSASTLAGHRSIHTGELPHKCNYCDKRFRTRGQVNVHHRTHTGERPFVCEVCSQSFRHRETLIAHLSRHIGMKRYKCYSCDKQFACISGLRMHRFTRPHTCGKSQMNTRAVGPRVRVIKGRVMFEPEPPGDTALRASIVQNVQPE